MSELEPHGGEIVLVVVNMWPHEHGGCHATVIVSRDDGGQTTRVYDGVGNEVVVRVCRADGARMSVLFELIHWLRRLSGDGAARDAQAGDDG